MKKIIFSLLPVCICAIAYSQSGSITNIQVSQRTDGSGLVDINFNLNGQGTNYYIILDVSFDAGSKYSKVHSTYTSGDVGPIDPGNSKHIVWNGFQSHPDTYSTESILKITAVSSSFPSTGQPCPGTPTVTYQGKTYNTILIGDQCWLKENLNIGEMISNTFDQTDNEIIEKYCYDNDIINCEIYGGLYQWDEAMQYNFTPGTQGICPAGWHIPTDNEWKILEGNVDSQYGIDSPEWDQTGSRGFDAGKNLKSLNGWGDSGTDYYGFSGLPSGFKRHDTGGFEKLGENSYYWTSNRWEINALYSWLRVFGSSNTVNRIYSFEVRRTSYNTISSTKMSGFSIRCIKD